MREGVSTLSYAVRFGVLGKYLGQLALTLAVLVLVPLLASMLFHEYDISLRYLPPIALLAALGLLSLLLPEPKTIQTNEALVIVALAFILSPLLMTYPLMVDGVHWLDALFEAISAVTTTGLTTITELENKPRSFLFARAWMQWYGGLGIVILSVALLMGHHIAARRLTEPTSTETLATTARTHARRMLVVYLILTLFFFLLLWWLSQDSFVALTHTLAAVSTGGFSSYNHSLAGTELWSVRYAVIFAALCGAIPLPLFYQAWQSGWRTLWQDLEVRTLLCCTLLVTLALSWFFLQNVQLPWPQALQHAGLMAVSAQSTAGFNSLPVTRLDDASKLTLIFSMLIGGGVGSTAGGMKILRLLVVLKVLQFLLQRTAMPSHAVAEPRLEGKLLESNDVQRILLLILLFFIVIGSSWFVFVISGYPALDALFEVVSATGTAGLSSGVTSSELSPLLKAVLCLDMLLGRLEIVAILVVLYPPTWFGKRA